MYFLYIITTVQLLSHLADPMPALSPLTHSPTVWWVWSRRGGSEVEPVHTGCPLWPPKLPSLGRCVCVSVSAHPGSSPGPGKSPGHTDTDLSSATLRLIPDFMGAREGGVGGAVGLGRCTQLGPPWVSSPSSSGPHCSAGCAAAGLRRGRGAISWWHRDTKMSPVTVKYKGCAPDRWVPQWTGCHREARGSRALLQWRCRGRPTVTHWAPYPLSLLFLSGPFFPPLGCFSGRPVEKCFEKNETSRGSIA